MAKRSKRSKRPILNALVGKKRDWGHLAHVQDVRRLDIGTCLGPGMGVVECPSCHRPAIRNGISRRKDGLHERFAHELHYYVSKLGRTRLAYETRCVAGDVLDAPCSGASCGPTCKNPPYKAAQA